VEKQTFVSDIWGICSPILLYYMLSLFFSPMLGAFFPALLLEEHAMWFLATVNLLMLPIFLWMYGKDRIRYTGRMQKERIPAGKDVALVVAGAACLSRAANLLIGLTPLPYFFPEYERISRSIYSCSLISQIAASVIGASLLEEVLIRGLVYRRMRFIFRNPKIPMIISALLFGMFHGNVVQGVYAFFMGLFFVQVYERYQSLWFAILAHMAANMTSILLEHFTWLNEAAQDPAIYLLQTTGFLLVGVFLWKVLSLSCSSKE